MFTFKHWSSTCEHITILKEGQESLMTKFKGVCLVVWFYYAQIFTNLPFLLHRIMHACITMSFGWEDTAGRYLCYQADQIESRVGSDSFMP